MIPIRYALLAGLALSAPAQEPPLRGYSKEAARLERQWEARFRAIPDAKNLRGSLLIDGSGL
jgi:hypothetical protein